MLSFHEFSGLEVLDRGSRYCGDLSLLMATIVEAGNYLTRVIDVSDGSEKPSTHVVVEVYYGDEWHLYDPTYGLSFRDTDGTIASYKQLRLNTCWINEAALGQFGLPMRDRLLEWMPVVYSSGYHHIYRFKKKSAQCNLWMPSLKAILGATLLPSQLLPKYFATGIILEAVPPSASPGTKSQSMGSRKARVCKLCDLEAGNHQSND